MFTPGDKLEFGHYTILRELGSGGMGVVYHCRDEFLQREIAIKMMLPELMADADISEVFRQEARLAAQLEHPNIVTIHNIGMENREGKVHHYIAMEFLPGGSLKGRIGKEKISLEQAVEWMKQMASALNYAHKRGVVHQDIKPDNIFITQEGNLKIGDFGLAQIATGPAFERTAQGKGSPAYMSPELCRGEPHDHRSDIYSLGSVFYEMLTGERPFKAAGMIEMALKHATAPVPSAGKVRTDTPAILDKVIKYMMAKSPDERLQSLNDVLPSLEKMLLEMKVARLGVGGASSDKFSNAAPTQVEVSKETTESAPAEKPPAETKTAVATAETTTIDCSPAEEKKAPVVAKEAPKTTPSGGLDPTKEKQLELLWTYKTKGPIGWQATPGLHRNRKHIYLPSADGALYAIDMNTGRLQWHVKTEGALLSSPLVVADEVYCTGVDGYTYSIYAGDGSVNWKFQSACPVVTSPVASGDHVFVAAMDGSVKAFAKADGKVVWTYRCDGGIVSNPQVVENTLFVASKDKALHAIDTEKGVRKWHAEGSGAFLASVLASTDSVYCASVDGKIFAYEIETGNPVWKFETNSSFLCRGNLEFTSLNYCTKNGGIHSIDKFKGTLLWQASAGGPALGGASSVGGSLYLGTRNGILHSFNVKTGELNWYHTFESGLESAPLVTSTQIFQGTISGDLYAFVAPPKAK